MVIKFKLSNQSLCLPRMLNGLLDFQVKIQV